MRTATILSLACIQHRLYIIPDFILKSNPLMQKLKKKFQLLEPSLKDAGHLRSTEDALLLKRLFALCAAQMITVMVSRRSEKRINIRLDCLYLLYFFFELRTFIIESLLLVKKSLLFRLQCLQARQFFHRPAWQAAYSAPPQRSQVRLHALP